MFAGRARQPQHGIRPAARGDVEERFAVMGGRGHPRHQVDHAAERGGAVQRRGRALDHFDPLKIHRRHLQQAERGRLGAVDRQAVGQHGRIPAVQALHPNRRGAKRRRRRLQSNAAGLVQQHRDVTRRHQELLLDFLAADDLDPQRLIGGEAARARRRDDDRFLHFRKFFERDVDRAASCGDRDARGSQAVLRHHQRASRRRHGNRRAAVLVGAHSRIAAPNLGLGDGLTVVTDDDRAGDGLRKQGEQQKQWQQHGIPDYATHLYAFGKW